MSYNSLIGAITAIAIITAVAVFLIHIYRNYQNILQHTFVNQLNIIKHELHQQLAEIQQNITEKNHRQAQDTNDRAVQHMTTLQKVVQEAINNYATNLSTHVEKFTNSAEAKLQNISSKVADQLNSGFKQTNETVNDIIKRLAIIDSAQQKITSLSENVVSLQQLLADKRSRGAFGEVQLKNLIENMLPTKNVSFQYTLSNETRCDCMLHLPAPIGNLAIDAKFPLESYYLYSKPEISSGDRDKAMRQFRQDIKKHIQDIANKYIIANETADGAIMFIPAEAIFAEIHSNLSEIVAYAHEKRVWLASPTTMMAILTTASAVLKDSATKEHIHVIQEHLKELAKDFSRFDDRLQKLTRHISLAHEDAQQVNTSAKKITTRFTKIEQAELATVDNIAAVMNNESVPEPITADEP